MNLEFFSSIFARNQETNDVVHGQQHVTELALEQLEAVTGAGPKGTWAEESYQGPKGTW